MNRWEEVINGIFPVLAGYHQYSNTRRPQRSCCPLDAKAPDNFDDLDISSIPRLPTETELIPVSGQLKPEFI
jgi:hypothetical protein